MLVAGHGRPVVVLEAGLGDTISTWEKVQPEVARFACVVAYDRAGLGKSEPAVVESRTTAQIARELHTALRKAKLRPPYVLVGHSMGGLHVRLFAHQFPEEVAGLVLVDPSAEDWNDLLKAQFPDEYAKMMAWRTRNHPEGMKKELAAWETSREQARGARPLPQVPVVLFTGLKGNPGGTGIILKLHTEWLQTIPGATHIVTEKSGHYLHTTEPELVVNAISNIVARVRSRAAPPAAPPTKTEERGGAVLNQLRDEINAHYGYREGVPRINLGPCGRFAKAFREQWNARFLQKVSIAFVMANDGSQCHHVVVRLPDGNYYDGGNGVMSERTLLGLFPQSRMEEMRDFDLKLLDQRSYGLGRNYPVCPNYSDDITARLIENWLAQLPGNIEKP